MVLNPVEDSVTDERRGWEDCVTHKPLLRDFVMAVSQPDSDDK